MRYLRSRFLSHLSTAVITSRLLASTTDSDVSERACALLREARNLTYRWICELGLKLDHTQDETSRAGLRHRLFMLATTCFSTFDVCPEHIHAILAIEEDFSIAMQCAVIVHDNTPPSLSDDNFLHLARMFSRHRRLLHSLEPILGQSLPGVVGHVKLLRAGAYDHALAKLWLGYRRRTFPNWHVLQRSDSRWIRCRAEGSHEVHFDLLTGQLLIGGKRLGRLPQEIVEHPTYASILGTVSCRYLLNLFCSLLTFSLENSRCWSCRHPRNGLHDSNRRLWVSGK